MNPIQLMLTFTMAAGTYLIVTAVLRLPSRKAVKAISAIDRRQKRKVRNGSIRLDELAMQAGKWIHLSEYSRRKMAATLQSANIKMTPEMYIARAWIKSAIVLLCVIPTMMILPLISPVVMVLAIAVYFKEIKFAEERVKQHRADIEFELPRFVSTLTQELKASRNVLTILDTYKNNAGTTFKKELEITAADMKSGSYESALTRMEARIGSAKLSDVTRGLIGVLRGDDGIIYFQMLAHDLKLLQFQQLKTIAMKRPGKIRKYSFAMLFCFLLMYLSVMFIEILNALGNMF